MSVARRHRPPAGPLRRLADAARPARPPRVLGITGAPGAGKTTLVAGGARRGRAADPRLAGRVAHVPMDGFHLPNAELDRLGRRDRKGAPDTFDVAGVCRVRSPPCATSRGRRSRAPSFDHAVGEPGPDDIECRPRARTSCSPRATTCLPGRGRLGRRARAAGRGVVLRPRRRAAASSAWWSGTSLAGREPDDARAWVDRSDEANARLVVPTAATRPSGPRRRPRRGPQGLAATSPRPHGSRTATPQVRPPEFWM